MLSEVIGKLLLEAGPQRLNSLSADYETGNYLEERVRDTIERIEEIWGVGQDIAEVLARCSEDRAVRIMTVHKSKGLEFDSVVFLAVEKETFWAKPDDERAHFFVGISRAKRRLRLTCVESRPLPSGKPNRWVIQRGPHREFLSYAAHAK